MKRRDFIIQSSLSSLGMLAIAKGCNRSLTSEYIILGGGISGLYTAWLLDQAGKTYTILEGSQRIGGRLYTHEKIGRDVGGRGIGDRYDEIMKLVRAFNVELIDITDTMRSPTSIYVNGTLHPKWDDVNTNPSLLAFMNIKDGVALDQLDDWYKRPDLDITYADYLASVGKTKEEIELINISANYNNVHQTSNLNSLHSSAFRKFNGSKRIYNFKGGAKAFISKVAAGLKGTILTGRMVTKIEDKDGVVSIKCRDGNAYTSAKVICTLPFTTLRNVDLNIDLNHNQKKAIQELSYTLITQVHLDAKSAYWEEDGAPVSMWTDTPLERIMNLDTTGKSVALCCWVNGTGTEFIDAMSEKEVEEYTLRKLAEMRPASEGNVEYVGRHSWGKYEYNKGAYVEFGVGQASWFEDMIRPAGNIHFAGEHTAAHSRGIEAAGESAVRVIKELNI